MKFLIRTTVLVLASLAIFLGYIHSLPDVVVAIGEPVRQDDFLYTVTGVVTHREHERIAYTVTIRVDNRAKTVDYRWRDEIAYVSDATGKQYHAEGNPNGASERPPIPTGESATYTLTFVLPAAAPTPVLRYSNGVMMGDVIDGAAYRRAAIPL